MSAALTISSFMGGLQQGVNTGIALGTAANKAKTQKAEDEFNAYVTDLDKKHDTFAPAFKDYGMDADPADSSQATTIATEVKTQMDELGITDPYKLNEWYYREQAKKATELGLTDEARRARRDMADAQRLEAYERKAMAGDKQSKAQAEALAKDRFLDRLSSGWMMAADGASTDQIKREMDAGTFGMGELEAAPEWDPKAKVLKARYNGQDVFVTESFAKGRVGAKTDDAKIKRVLDDIDVQRDSVEKERSAIVARISALPPDSPDAQALAKENARLGKVLANLVKERTSIARGTPMDDEQAGAIGPKNVSDLEKMNPSSPDSFTGQERRRAIGAEITADPTPAAKNIREEVLRRHPDAVQNARGQWVIPDPKSKTGWTAVNMEM